MPMEAEKTGQAREQRVETSAKVRESARHTRQTPTQEAPLMQLTQLRAAAAQPDGLLQLPPQQLRLLAAALGNGAMTHLLEDGPQPWLEQPSQLLSLQRTMSGTTMPSLSPNPITTTSPMLSPGPMTPLPTSELPPPSLCRISAD